MQKKWSIILTAYNNLSYSAQAIDRILRYSPIEKVELILIDDASTDGTYELFEALSGRHPFVKAIHHLKNQGYIKSANDGLKQAKGDYLVCVNNDVLVTPSWLQRLTYCLEQKLPMGEFGLVGPATNFSAGRQQVPGARYDFDKLDLFAKEFADQNHGNWDEAGSLKGWLLMFKRKVYEDIGGFDERFSPGGFEDDSYCLDARKKGWKSAIAGDTFVHHFGSKTFDLPEMRKYKRGVSFENYKRFSKKYFTDEERLIVVYRIKNSAQWISESLRSSSRFADEILVLDDGSTDNTAKIAKEFSKVKLETQHEEMNEKRDREFLYNWAKKEGATWIVSCFPAGTKVEQATGMKSIEEVHVGDEVLSHTGQDRKVTKTFGRQFEGNLVEIRTSDMRNIPLRVTPEHPLLAIKGADCKLRKHCTSTCASQVNRDSRWYGKLNNCHRKYESYKIEWIRAKNLTSRDFLLYPIPKENERNLVFNSEKYVGREHKQNGDFGEAVYKKFELPISKELMRLFGYYIAEGCFDLSNGTINFAFHKDEKILHKDVLKLMHELFDIEGCLRASKVNKGVNIQFSARRIGEKFKELFGARATEKTFPKEFLGLPDGLLVELFRGWYKGDGCSAPDRFNVTTSSEDLAFRMRDLLLRLRVLPRIRKEYKYCSLVKRKLTSFSFDIGGRNLEKLRKYDLVHPFVKVRKYTTQKYPFFFKEGYVCIPIVKIKSRAFSGSVYNLEVDKDNSYTCFGKAVHNCDGDEVFDKRMTKEYAKSLMHPKNPMIKGYICRVVTFWRGRKNIRVDSTFNNLAFTRMYKVEPKQHFSSPHPKGLHCSSAPKIPLENLAWCPVRILHYGYETFENAQKKYKFYEKEDKHKMPELIGREDYSHLIDETNLQVREFQPKNSLSLATMIRDEEDFLWQFLDRTYPVFDKLVFAVDSRTKDKSREIVEWFGAKCITVEFDNSFADMRNAVKAQCRSDWLLQLDPDEKIPRLNRLLWYLDAERADAFIFSVENLQPTGRVTFSESYRMFKNVPEIYYSNRVHETVESSLAKMKATVRRSEVKIRHLGYLKGDKRVEEKLVLYEKLNQLQMKDDPKDAKPYFNLALHYLNNGEKKKGMEFLEEAKKLDPKYYLPRKELGLTYLRMAQEEFGVVLQLLPKEHPMYSATQQLFQEVVAIAEAEVKVGMANQRRG